jgi:hypothetical protein
MRHVRPRLSLAWGEVSAVLAKGVWARCESAVQTGFAIQAEGRMGAGYGTGLIPSARTFQPVLGKPGAWPVEPPQPPAIIATASSSDPFDGK